jgi:hypothetical protein
MLMCSIEGRSFSIADGAVIAAEAALPADGCPGWVRSTMIRPGQRRLAGGDGTDSVGRSLLPSGGTNLGPGDIDLRPGPGKPSADQVSEADHCRPRAPRGPPRSVSKGELRSEATAAAAVRGGLVSATERFVHGWSSLVVGVEHDGGDSGGYSGERLGHQVHPQRRPGEHAHHGSAERDCRVERATRDVRRL